MFRVATFNVEWFFSKAPFADLELCDVPTKARRLSDAIAQLGCLDALALQEVQSEVELGVLCDELKKKKLDWSPVSVCGERASVRTGQRVAWLYNADSIKLRAHGTFDLENFSLLEKNVWLDVEWRNQQLRLICVHMKVQERAREFHLFKLICKGKL